MLSNLNIVSLYSQHTNTCIINKFKVHMLVSVYWLLLSPTVGGDLLDYVSLPTIYIRSCFNINNPYLSMTSLSSIADINVPIQAGL